MKTSQLPIRLFKIKQTFLPLMPPSIVDEELIQRI